MGILTQAMTRLRGEIVSSRQSRDALRGALARQAAERRTQVSALCTAFARDREGARRAWSGRTPYEREAAGREERRGLAERPERRSPAVAAHEPAKPVRAPTERPPVAPLPPAQRTPFKGSKKR
jgi:hypothetical protein